MKDLKAVDFNLLKALDALMAECNVTRAAARLGVTQPAMSSMLTRLRETFEDPLFVRASRGIVPTQRALELAGPLKQVMSEIGALLAATVFDPLTAQQTFCIAATDYALRAVALPLIRVLKERAPNLRLSFVSVEDDKIQTRLERAEIDLALVTPGSASPDLHARDLFVEHYVCAIRKDHPAIKDGNRLTVDQFCSLEHVLVSYSGNGFLGVTDEALEQLGKRRQVSLSVQSFLIVPELLQTSDLVAVLPSRLVAGINGLEVFEPPIDIPGFTKTAVWHERTHRDAAHRWLRESLFEISADTRAHPGAGVSCHSTT